MATIKTKTLLVDSEWNLKRNFHKQKTLLSSTATLCGGTIGYINSLKTIMEKLVPDKVVSFWDGFNAGKLRYDMYKPYKANRNKDWEKTERAVINDGIDCTEEEREKFEMLKQKLQVKDILDDLFVRQAEMDFIEADDMIAQYILNSENDDEIIYVYSRDKDYLQLISDKVFIISPDNLYPMGRKEYEEKYGTTVDNELLFKCFEGDSSDCVKGVKGITRNTLIKYFPAIAKEKYTYKRLVEESYEAKKTKKLKTYDTIIGAQEILYRNAKLMNLKKPFVNQQAIKLVEAMKHGVLDNDRDIKNSINKFVNYGLMIFVGDHEYVDNFLSPFYGLMLKEKKYSQTMQL